MFSYTMATHEKANVECVRPVYAIEYSSKKRQTCFCLPSKRTQSSKTSPW